MSTGRIDLDPARMRAALNNSNDVGFRVEMQIHDGRIIGLSVAERDWERSVLAGGREHVDDPSAADVAALIHHLCEKTRGRK